MTKEELMIGCNITEDQYYGRSEIKLLSISNRIFLNNTKIIPMGFNPIITGIYGESILQLQCLEYWPKWFKPRVDIIRISSLKSPTLKKLIENKSTRQLAYNLINNL